ncbi:DUF192 domain-containing protein [Candidatus Woesearchaeota archaeon]|nr:DUF192 domain-containing protein [Candidatus Woesearchaeota archaeon]
MTKKFAKNSVKILLVFMLIFLVNCTKISDKTQKEIFIDNGGELIGINAEIADDKEEMMKGLMFREKLEENSGMLFIFENEGPQTFWMKNTLIPLDIIFIGNNFEIVDIKGAEPCSKDPCKYYASSGPAKYVLEVNAGFAAGNKINVDDKLILNQ